MVKTKFKELNNNFAKLQFFLEAAAKQNSAANLVLNMLMGPNKNHIMVQANIELAQIRDFYCERFYSASEAEKVNILKRYQEFYSTLSKISNGELTIDIASKKLCETTNSWEDDIVFNNVLHVCFAITCALPLVAGLVILPFALPVISLDFFIGATLLTAASSSIILALSQCYNNLSNIESTKPVRSNSLLELSFLNNMSMINSCKRNLDTNATEDNVDDYATGHQTPAFH
jgi:hypothetical protein